MVSESESDLSDIGTSFMVPRNYKRKKRKPIERKQKPKKMVIEQKKKRVKSKKVPKKDRKMKLKVTHVDFYQDNLRKNVAKQMFMFQDRRIEQKNKYGESSHMWMLENGGDFFREYVTQKQVSYMFEKINMFISKILYMETPRAVDIRHFQTIGSLWSEMFDTFEDDMDEATAYIVKSMSLFQDMRIRIKNTVLIKTILGMMFHAATLIFMPEKIEYLKNTYNFTYN